MSIILIHGLPHDCVALACSLLDNKLMEVVNSVVGLSQPSKDVWVYYPSSSHQREQLRIFVEVKEVSSPPPDVTVSNSFRGKMDKLAFCITETVGTFLKDRDWEEGRFMIRCVVRVGDHMNDGFSDV